MLMKISDIVIKDRKRKINTAKVNALAQSIETVGLLNPVTIDEQKNLISGLHRIEAYKQLGHKLIECTMIPTGFFGIKHMRDDLPTAEAESLITELAEIDENLVRNELDALERGEHLSRRKEIYETLYPETRRGVAGVIVTNKILGRGDATPESGVASFVDDTAQKTGRSKSAGAKRKFEIHYKDKYAVEEAKL